jgi:acetylornithine deacetylase/succinyl-diaminopimelate desuccinylase-like protein
MQPQVAYAQFCGAVEKLTPRGTQSKVSLFSSAAPSLVSTDNRFIQTAAKAMTEVFGKETVYIRSGGSIPIVGIFDQYAGIPSVMMGFGLPDDNLHAPNEKFHLPNFFNGITAVRRYLEMLGA